MGFFNIEKTNSNNNNQNTYFNQNPNMMNNQYNNGMYNNQGYMDPNMQQSMMNNNGMMPDYNNYNQGMMDYNQNMNSGYNQGMMPDYNNYNQGMMNNYDPNNYNGMNNGNFVNTNYQNNGNMYNQNMNNNMGNFQSPPTEPVQMPSVNTMPESTGELSRYEETINPNTSGQNSIYGNVEAPGLPNIPSNDGFKVDSSLSTIKPGTNESIETLNFEETALPRETEAKQEELVKEEMIQNPTVPPVDKVPEGLNPLDNDKNPIPVNPILAPIEQYTDVEDIGNQKDVKANVFAAIGIILGMIFKPGTTIMNNSKKFKNIGKAFSIMLWLSFIFLVLCIAVRAAVGSFARTYSSLTDSYKIVIDMSRIFEVSNYLPYIIATVALAIGGVLLVTLIYYASSFLNSKGVTFSTYLVVSNLGMIPIISGVIILYPIASIFSIYLGIGVVIFTFLITIITLLIGMNGVLKFKSVNNQIYYHVINLSIITLITVMILVFVLHQGWMAVPTLSF